VHPHRCPLAGQLNDGASLATSLPRLRVPISYALHFPERAARVPTLDLAHGELTFEPPDLMLPLSAAGREAGEPGHGSCVLNAVEECRRASSTAACASPASPRCDGCWRDAAEPVSH